jgi:hypothetical protein
VKKWIEALRSGDYAQTKSDLRYDNSFCCLGVGCDMYDESLWGGESFCFEGRDYNQLPPKEVLVWLGVPEDLMQDRDANEFDVFIPVEAVRKAVPHRIPPKEDNLTASGLNDDGYTFGEIADILEVLDVEAEEKD